MNSREGYFDVMEERGVFHSFGKILKVPARTKLRNRRTHTSHNVQTPEKRLSLLT